jgi:phage terminase large subunit-like protein
VNRIVFRSTGTVIAAVANDYEGFSGANPTLNVYDELAYYTGERSRRLWDEGVPSPARRISFRLSVSTAGFDGEASPLRDIYDRTMAHGEALADDLYRDGNLLAYWTHALKAPWQSQAWLDEMRRTLRPGQFKRLIENEWASSEGAFIDLAEWDSCVNPSLRPLLADSSMLVFAGLDCSVRHDGTAIAVCALDCASNRVRVVNHRLFRPEGKDIDFAAVEQELIGLAKRFNLASVYFDPFQAESLAQRLRTAGVNMMAFPQTSANLTAAASNLLALVQSRNLTTYASEELRTAIANCITIESARGYKLAKTVASRKIDLAAALSFAALAAVRGGQRQEPSALVRLREDVIAQASARYGTPTPQPAAPAMASSAVAVQGFAEESQDMRVARHFRREQEEEQRSRGAL